MINILLCLFLWWWTADPTYGETSWYSYPKYGYRISSGDFDNNGYDDPMIGAPYWDGEALNEGRVYVYFMTPYVEEMSSQIGKELKIYPNPATKNINIWYKVNKDDLGNEVATVVDELHIPGNYKINWVLVK